MSHRFISDVRTADISIAAAAVPETSIDTINNILDGLKLSQDDKKSLLSLTFSPTPGVNLPIFSIDNRETLYELMNYVGKFGIEQSIKWFSTKPFDGISDREQFIWLLPTLDVERRRADADVSMLTYKERSVKGTGKCGKCGGTEVIYRTKQKRAGDEGETTFAYCTSVGCTNQWRLS